jgi:hypothetical protein
MPASRLIVVFFVLVHVTACGAATATRAIDEEGDEGGSGGGGGGGSSHVVAMPTDLGNTEWSFVEAECTEGPLDLASRGFVGRMHVVEEAAGSLLLVQDHTYGDTGCELTIVTRVSSPTEPGELRMEEIARVSVPSTPECFGQPEPPRPGEVRRAGRRIEVLTQRSRWCGGFEVRFAFDPAMPRMLSNAELARHYAVYFSLGDADALAGLFAQVSSLAEPFTTTTTGDPYRHDGRDAVRQWFVDAFAGTAWRALRITGSTPGATPHEITVTWEYMDSRLAAPLTGANHFTTAAGEIFETRIELSSAPEVASEFAGP